MSAPPPVSTHGRPWVDGVLAGAPLAVAIVPFAWTIGTTIARSDLDPVAAWSGSFLLFGGSAQLAAIQLLDAGGGVIAAAVTAVLINARFAIYGPALARWFATESWIVRAVLALPIVDQTFLVCDARFVRGDLDARGRRSFYLGVVVPSSVVWVAAQAASVAFHDVLPAPDALSLGPALLFAGLLAASLSDIVRVRSAIVAGVVTILGRSMLGPAALGVGIVAGVLASWERR